MSRSSDGKLDDIAGGALQALVGLDENSWVAFNAGLGVMMLGAGASILASKTHPVLGWIALVAGIALFIPFADLVRGDRQRSLADLDEHRAVPARAGLRRRLLTRFTPSVKRR